MKDHKIFSYVDELESQYSEPIKIVEGLSINYGDIIKTVEFYTNSKYLSGDKDELGREKPFYNIVNYRVTVAKVATDVDVKDIVYEPDSLNDAVPAMLINHEMYKYFKEVNFSEELNEMGYNRPKYGELIVKKCKGEHGTEVECCDINNLHFDPSDIDDSPIIEDFYLSPSELSKKDGVWDNVKEVLKAHAKANKNRAAKILVKEVSGEFPIYFHPDHEGEEDSIEYKRMCFYIAVVNEKKYLMYCEYEKESRYMSLPWEEMSKRPGKGIVEDGFEAQAWTNDNMIATKNVMQLAGKVVFHTTSKKVAGSGNAITNVDNGHIFEREPNTEFAMLNMAPNVLPEFENQINLWKEQYNNAASTYDANTGEAPTAGTPYSQTALLNQVANSPFEYRREEFGIFLNEILNKWIFPEIKRRITAKHYLTSEFSEEEFKMIDEDIKTKNKNKVYLDAVLNEGRAPLPGEILGADIATEQKLSRMGKKREIEIPEGYLDIEGRVTANITGELRNKSVILQSLDNILKTVTASFNPNTGKYAVLEDPVLSKIFARIVEMAGIPGFFSGSLKSSGQATPGQDLQAMGQAPMMGAQPQLTA